MMDRQFAESQKLACKPTSITKTPTSRCPWPIQLAKSPRPLRAKDLSWVPNSAKHDDVNWMRNALMDAIRRDDAEMMEYLVQSGAPLVCSYYHRPEILATAPSNVGFVNPVDWAALEFRFRAAMRLLELSDHKMSYTYDRQSNAFKSVNIASQTKHAVYLGALQGHLGLLRRLLERSAYVAQRNAKQESALQIAVQEGHKSAVMLLLQYGAWDEENENQRDTVRALSMRTGLSSLLGVGSSSENELSMSKTSFSHSTEGASKAALTRSTKECTLVPTLKSPRLSYGNNPDGLRRLARLTGSETLFSWGWPPLESLPLTPMSAATQGPSVFGTKQRLSAGDIRLRGELRRAIRKGDLDRIHTLAVRDAPLDAVFDLGYGKTGTCIDWACATNQPESALKLIEEADARDALMTDELVKCSSAALFWCITEGSLDVLKVLLRRGGDIDARGGDMSGRLVAPYSGSLLRHAIHSVRPEELRELLIYGA